MKIMPEDKLLEEFAETLGNKNQKEYVESYISDKEKGLSVKFDENFEANIRET